MKNYLLLLVVAASLTTVSFADPVLPGKHGTAFHQLKVPGPVKAGFARQFPGVTPKWEREGGNYEANFTQNGVQTSAIFTPAGELKETEQEIAPAQLPASVKAYLGQHNKGDSVKEAAIIKKADGSINYEAEVKGKDLIFDANGHLLSKG